LALAEPLVAVAPAADSACRARLRALRLGRVTRALASVSRAGRRVSEASITSSTPIEAEIATP
jgi:hypothetical protein